jgi:predicted AAA+ superfamily ATPase
VYFYDLGVRNTIIGDFRPLNVRTDIGAIWENFLITERKKTLNHADQSVKTYFWRTTQQQEVDYIEEKGIILSAFEMKWNSKKVARLPLTFSKAYEIAAFECVTPNNYVDFLTVKTNL